MQGLKAELLRGFWYMALPGARLKPGKLAHLMMLGEPIVVGRGRDGLVFALRDICPHRGIPLHYGRFDGETIECAYHAWRFDRNGTCVDVPSMTAEQKIDMSKIRCGAYHGGRAAGHRLGLFSARRREARRARRRSRRKCRSLQPIAGRTCMSTSSSPARSTTPTYGLMDPAHVAYVHTSRWFRAKTRHVTEKTKSFEPKGLGFKMVAAHGAADPDLLQGARPEGDRRHHLSLARDPHRGAARRPPSGRRPDGADADHRRGDHVPPDVLDDHGLDQAAPAAGPQALPDLPQPGSQSSPRSSGRDFSSTRR